MKTPEGAAYLHQHYNVLKKSPRKIAEELGTYHNAVVRALNFHNFKKRDRSKAAKNSLETGVATHPTEGRQRTPEERDRISQGLKHSWDMSTDEQREKYAQRARTQWESYPEDKKQEIREAASRGNLEASKRGSKLERYLVTALQVKGYAARHHANFVIENEEMHIDILIPEQKVAIEVDGPAHYLPIWGEEKLAKSQAADQVKNGLLMKAGYRVLRIQHLAKQLSRHHKSTALERTLAFLQSLDSQSKLTLITTD